MAKKMKTFTVAQKVKAVEDLDNGVGIWTIAKRLGCTDVSVYTWRKHLRNKDSALFKQAGFKTATPTRKLVKDFKAVSASHTFLGCTATVEDVNLDEVRRGKHGEYAELIQALKNIPKGKAFKFNFPKEEDAKKFAGRTGGFMRKYHKDKICVSKRGKVVQVYM